jgi:hypothetical protein
MTGPRITLPAMAKSVRAIIGDKPFAVGPSAIGMRFNPCGAAPQANPKDIRQAMNCNDPRQRGLLGAAWNLAYFAHFARHGAEAIALGGLIGPFGAIYSKTAWRRPGSMRIRAAFIRSSMSCVASRASKGRNFST